MNLEAYNSDIAPENFDNWDKCQVITKKSLSLLKNQTGRNFKQITKCGNFL